MPQAEYNYEDFNQNAQSSLDDTLLVKFEYRPKENKTESKLQGRPIFMDVLYIDIRTPGSKDHVCRPAKDRDIKRFPRHHRAFMERVDGQEARIEGTLLTEWPLVTRAMCEELAYFNVKTVEQLVGMSDAHSGQFMGINNLKRKAQAWLETAKEQNAAMHLKTELELRDQTIAELREQMAELQELVKKPKRGRPAKKKEEEPKEEA